MEQINKVNYTGEGVEVCYTLTEKGYAEEIKEYIKDEPHGDFLAALRALGAHFAVLSELRGIPADYIKGLSAWDAEKVRQSAAGARERYDGSHQGGRTTAGRVRRPYGTPDAGGRR